MTQPDPTPTRDGVTLVPGIHVGRDDLVTLPGKGGKLRSDRRWRLAYDADPIVIWEASPRGIARIRVAGPASAAAWIRTTVANARQGHRPTPAIAVYWEGADPIDAHGHMSHADIDHRNALVAAITATEEN